MIELIINPDSVIETKNKQILSEIYFSVNGIFFPDKCWDDFAAVILGWWITETLSSMQNRKHIIKKRISKDTKTTIASISDCSTCPFMDGPYYFHLLPKNDLFNINFICDRKNREIIVSDEINQIEFLKVLIKNANLLIRVAHNKRICHKDIDSLQYCFKIAQNFVSRANVQ
jgi:hypothetical protein